MRDYRKEWEALEAESRKPPSLADRLATAFVSVLVAVGAIAVSGRRMGDGMLDTLLAHTGSVNRVLVVVFVVPAALGFALGSARIGRMLRHLFGLYRPPDYRVSVLLWACVAGALWVGWRLLARP